MQTNLRRVVRCRRISGGYCRAMQTNLRRGAMGAPPVAESSDLSEWQRSVCNAAALSARRTQGTATGHSQTNLRRGGRCKRIDRAFIQYAPLPHTTPPSCLRQATSPYTGEAFSGRRGRYIFLFLIQKSRHPKVSAPLFYFTSEPPHSTTVKPVRSGAVSSCASRFT